MRPVTHDTFDADFAAVAAGRAVMQVPTALRIYQIDQRAVRRFGAIAPIKKSADGKGFRMVNGKGSVYVLPGQLVVLEGA